LAPHGIAGSQISFVQQILEWLMLRVEKNEEQEDPAARWVREQELESRKYNIDLIFNIIDKLKNDFICATIRLYKY
jgi:hypothetical protein